MILPVPASNPNPSSRERSILPRHDDTDTVLDRLTLGPDWCRDLHAAGVDVYGRPIGGAA